MSTTLSLSPRVRKFRAADIFDNDNLFRASAGFDRLFEDLMRLDSSGNYPPHNIVKTVDENNVEVYEIQLAVAGFAEEELDVVREKDRLTITGNKAEVENDPREFLHRGIAERGFTKTLVLADNMEILGAELLNGLLTIRLQHIVPEEQQPKRIAINGK